MPAANIQEGEIVVGAFHLDRLRHAGLITVVRKGCWKIYSARGEIMKNLLNYLTDDCSPRKRVLGEINDVEMWGVDRLPLWSVARTRDSLAGVRILTMPWSKRSGCSP
jgi:hypothetical protein